MGDSHQGHQHNYVVSEFLSYVEKNPDALAYRTHTSDTSYLELAALSAEIARIIADQVEGTSPIAVLGAKTARMPAAFLACLATGHAYVPIDEQLPSARIQDIVSQLDNPHLMSFAEDSRLLAEIGTALTVIDLHDLETHLKLPASAAEIAWPVSKQVTGNDTQYIIFTSGSTGRPKGIEVSADNVQHFAEWMHTFPVVGAGAQAFLDQAPYSFDLSVYSLVGALTTGGSLHALSPEAQGSYQLLLEELEHVSPTVWVSTPSFADFCLVSQQFDQALLPGLSLFLFCGEALHHTTVQQLSARFTQARVANTYGPTESTVAISFDLLTDEDMADPAPLHVGHVKPGTHVRIVDHATRKDVPAHTSGEIIIVGNTVAKGYYKNPEKTAEAFFEDADTHERAYATGDIGHLDEEGRLHCEGRINSYLKLNGFRIELAEIEGALEALPELAQAAVVPIERAGRIHHLKASVVAAPDYTPADKLAFSKSIKDQLAKALPHYMIPRVISVIDTMPLTANGKIDRKALV